MDSKGQNKAEERKRHQSMKAPRMAKQVFLSLSCRDDIYGISRVAHKTVVLNVSKKITFITISVTFK